MNVTPDQEEKWTSAIHLGHLVLVHSSPNEHDLKMTAAAVAAGLTPITLGEGDRIRIDPGTAAEADRKLEEALGKQVRTRSNATQAQLIALTSNELTRMNGVPAYKTI